MPDLIIRDLGLTDYQHTWHAMQAFTAQRDTETPDELWVTEHEAVYTLGLNRKEVRMPTRDDIPVVPVDRGGKITYHGRGQVIIYLLIDLKRKNLSIRQVVSAMENCMISLLAEYHVQAEARATAPGVYVNEKKIGALGLRLKNQCSYHGLSLNVAMDLSPFCAIDPCGYQGQEVTQMRDLGIELNIESTAKKLLTNLSNDLQYGKVIHESGA
jgi:lipoyl(octanoyl) transferase